MKIWMTTWKYECFALIRNRSLLAGLLLVFFAGIFSIQYGSHVIKQQQTIIDTVLRASVQMERSFLERVQKQDSIQAAYRTYARKMGVSEADIAQYQYGFSLAYGGVGETISWYPKTVSPLAIGQKDQYPFYHQLAPYSDIYKETSAIVRNPQTVQVGNFDLSFVFIYLFPLLIIAMGYNIASSEQENGTFILLSVHSDPTKVLCYKLTFRIAVVFGLGLLLNVIAFAMLDMLARSHLSTMLSWVLATTIYILFWFSLVFLVTNFSFSGDMSALLLGGCWVLFLLLIPSFIQGEVEHVHLRGHARQMFDERGDFKKAAELSNQELLDSLQRADHMESLPEFFGDTSSMQSQPIRNAIAQELQIRFTHRLGHDIVAARASEYRAALAWNWINPTYVAQHTFNLISGTELVHYHDYLNSLEEIQMKRRYDMYQYLDGKRYSEEDFVARPPYIAPDASVKVLSILKEMFPIILMIIIFVSVPLLVHNYGRKLD